ncbi:hypothetical protein WH96_00005, partial [Kiloniella spongiae]
SGSQIIGLGISGTAVDVNGQPVGSDGDGSESTSVTVSLSTGTLVVDAAFGTVTPTGTPGEWTVTPAAGQSLSDVLPKLGVEVGAGFDGDVDVTVNSSSIEANTPPTSTEAGSGVETDISDNTYTDT